MLTVNEIFHSIQGESSRAGSPCVFVRLTACDLRCSWCDTAYAFHEGRKRSVDDVVDEVDSYGCDMVEITGGEPLLQDDVYPLMDRLLAAGRTVLVETGGHRSIERIPRQVIKIVDVKCPGSGEAHRNDWENLDRLAPHDEVKFVIQDRADYEFALDVLEQHKLSGRCATVLFSPVHGVLDPKTLAEWMLADRVPARLQMQLHKYILVSDTAGRMKSRPAVVLLSGGLDSYTAGALAKSEGFELYALTIRYGQRHLEEIAASRRVAGSLSVVRHLELALDLRGIGGSALTGDTPVPVDRDLSDTSIPVTYVPARNTIFLSLALGWAEALEARDLVIGVNALDYSGYPDCRPEFISAFERLARLATRAGVEGGSFRIHTPLIAMSKADIIRKGLALGLDYGLTHSCYAPRDDGRPCGRCDSCVLRARGFAEAGATDPLLIA